MPALTSQETLILVGAAVAAGCRPCLDVALGRCLELRIAPHDIARAREIGSMAASRARADMDEHADKALGEFVPAATRAAGTGTCACSAGSACAGPAT